MPPQSPQWQRFVSVVRRNAPHSPISLNTAFQRAQSHASNVVNGVSVADGMGQVLPTPVAVAATLGTATSGQDIVDGAVDEIAGQLAGGFHPEGGMFVTNGIATLRGAVRAVERSDRVEDYLNQVGGYTDALARASINACFESYPYGRIPQPPIPPHANRMGRLYSSRTRHSWTRGHARIANVIRDMDQLTPQHGDNYSKATLIQLFLNATGLMSIQTRQIAERYRPRVDEYVLTRILLQEYYRQGTNHRRWGNSG